MSLRHRRRGWRLVSTCEHTRCEFGLAARQFAPALYGAHTGRVRIAIEEVARPIPYPIARNVKVSRTKPLSFPRDAIRLGRARGDRGMVTTPGQQPFRTVTVLNDQGTLAGAGVLRHAKFTKDNRSFLRPGTNEDTPSYGFTNGQPRHVVRSSAKVC